MYQIRGNTKITQYKLFTKLTLCGYIRFQKTHKLILVNVIMNILLD
ncbi:MAG: hypothetical protein ACI83I_001145 [Bacteroidia bacterium]|jgi:hypothetical protein